METKTVSVNGRSEKSRMAVCLELVRQLPPEHLGSFIVYLEDLIAARAAARAAAAA